MSFTLIAEHNTSDPLSQYAITRIPDLFQTSLHKNYFPLSTDSLKPCIGCFSCWIKTPGACFIKDLSSTLCHHFVNDDVIVLVTSIAYGCYRSPMKAMLDRSIPTISPFFKLVKGEVHHCRRYKKLASHMIIAYNAHLTPAEEETFRLLTKGNSINYGIPTPTIYFCRTISDLEEALTSVHSNVSKEVQTHV